MKILQLILACVSVMLLISSQVAAADATAVLLQKQSKLVEKWGAEEINKITKKNILKPFDPDRVNDLKNIWNVIPENLAEQFTQAKAVKMLGRKGFGNAIDKVYISFTKSELENVVKNVDDFENVGTGAEKILRYRSDFKIPNKPAPGNPYFPSDIVTLNDLGKLEKVKGVDKLAKNIAEWGGGYPNEARRAVILKEKTGVNLIELGKERNIEFIDFDGIKKLEKLEMDEFYELNEAGKTVRIIEEVKSSADGIVGATNDFKSQILKINQALMGGLADQAKVVTKGTFADDVKKFIQKNGNLIEIVEGGI